MRNPTYVINMLYDNMTMLRCFMLCAGSGDPKEEGKHKQVGN
jgi:hypothetical protein